jgi:hypothetical protein
MAALPPSVTAEGLAEQLMVGGVEIGALTVTVVVADAERP